MSITSIQNAEAQNITPGKQNQNFTANLTEDLEVPLALSNNQTIVENDFFGKDIIDDTSEDDIINEGDFFGQDPLR